MDEHGGWWQLGRHLWSEELTAALGESFQRRAGMVERTWGARIQSDWITAELTMRLPSQVADELLERHWEHLRFSPRFIQSALYIATHRAVELAGEALSLCPKPGEMLKHVSMHFGWKTVDHLGIQYVRQLEALIPYLDLISDSDIYSFWECCNKHSWYSFRHTYLDHRLQGQLREHALLDEKDMFAEWDRRVDSGQLHWVDLLVDRLLSSGEQWSRISSLLGAWLGQRQTMSALQLATTAILHAGSRADLETLCIDGIEPIDEADAIIKDTRYAFRLRSLQ